MEALSRRPVVETLVADRENLLVVSGLGSPTWDMAAAGDHDGNYYLWGAMGGAVPIGLGLALAQPERPVLVLTGDGEMLMGIGSLATVAAQAPANLSIVVLNNQHYGETGMQKSHTGLGADLAIMAIGAGIARTNTVIDEAGVAALRQDIHSMTGPVFADVRIKSDDPPRVLPEKDGAILKDRFRAGLGLA